jgi:hypothetical protein
VLALPVSASLFKAGDCDRDSLVCLIEPSGAHRVGIDGLYDERTASATAAVARPEPLSATDADWVRR